jgi:hypothetical protein
VGAGVGADVGVYTKSTNAYIASGVVATIGGNILVTAESSESLTSVSAGVGAGGDVGVAANAGVHIFTLQTRAFIGQDPLSSQPSAGPGDVHADGSIALAANDYSNINEIVGVLAAGGYAGVGAAAGVNIFNPDTEAFIGAGANVTGDGGGAGLTVDTGGISIGYTPASTYLDPSNPSGAGIDTNNPGTMTQAESGNQSALESQGQVNTPTLGSMNLGSGSQSVQGDDPSLSGVRSASLATDTGFHGVAVAASNRDEIRTFTLSLAGGIAGVAVSAGVDISNATTKAYIGANATVNSETSGANAAQSVLVGAGDDFYHLAVAGGVGVGGVAVAPAVGVNIIDNTTEAFIGQSATVNALGDIAVAANASENVVMIGFGVAAGGVGVGGAVDVLSIDNTTTASIGDDATVYAGGNVWVDATDDTHVFLLSGALAVGGAAGIGGSVGVMIVDKNTDATIGDGAAVDALGNTADLSGVFDGAINGGNFHTTSARGVIVQAESSENILHIVAAGGAGGYVGAAGAVGVTLISSNTNAEIGADAHINTLHQNLAGPGQSVYVNAANAANVQTFMIGIAGGVGALSGAVDVGTLNNNISAKVDAGAIVNARGNIEVNAVGIKNITGIDISGSAGGVALGAAVSVWAIGTQIQKTTQEEDGSGNQSTSGSALSSSSGAADDSAGAQAQSASGTVTGGNGLGSFSGDSGNSNDSQSRVANATGMASTEVNSAAPTGSSISSAENAASTPAGTTAQMDGTATAGGNIGVTANEQANVTVWAGQVSGGAFGAGASVAILSVNDNVSALADGTLKAGGSISVNATLNETVNLNVIDGAAGGFVGIGAAVAALTDNSVTQASLGNVTGAGAVTVSANSTRMFNETTGQASLAAAAAGASFANLDVGGGTYASVDGGATLTNISSLSVSATSTVTPDAEAVAVSAGIGAFSANFSFVDISPDVEASIGANATVDASGTVSVDATSTTNATVDMYGVSLSASVGVGAMFAFLSIEGTTEASIGPDASITAHTTSSTPAGVTAVTVDATSTNDATSKVEGFTGSGLASVSVMLASAKISGETQASVGAGSSITGTLDVDAMDTSTGTPSTAAGGVGAFTGAGTSASAVLSRNVDAYIGNATGSNPSSQSTVTLNGAADVDATSKETATVTAAVATVGVLAIGVSVPNAEIDGNTRAYIGPMTTVNGSASNSGVTLQATDVSQATVNATAISISFALSGAIDSPSATIKRNTLAFIDSSGEALAGTGAVVLDASADDTASSIANGGGGGAINFAAMLPTATISGATDAYVAGSGQVTAGLLTIEASTVERNATTTADVLSIAIVGGAGVDSNATISGDVKAYIGSSATINVGGAVQVTATSTSNPTATAVDGQGGAISGGLMNSEVSLTTTTSAYIGDHTNIVNAGSLDVAASDTSLALITGTVEGGGGIEGRSAQTTATIAPTIEACIGQYVQANVSGDVSVIATSVRAQGDANSNEYGGGGIDVASASAVVNANPTVKAYIDTGSSITAGGSVQVQANAQSTPSSSSPLNDYIQSVNTSNGEITFTQSGLTTGDSVTYNPNGNSPILTGNGALQEYAPGSTTTLQLYNVVVVDGNTLQLGNLFDAGSIDASAPLITGSGVDSASGMIRFASKDNFVTGDSVVYSQNGNGNIGLNSGTTYYVRVIDPYTIELYTNLAAATAPVTSVSSSDVSSNKITVSNSFSNNEAVTYEAPTPIAFNSGDVNVSVASNGSLSSAPGANNIAIGSGTTWVAGDAVTYHTNGTNNTIGGLVNGVTYYVTNVSTANTSSGTVTLVQLATSYANATASTPTVITLTPDQSATGESYQEEFTQNAIGGLTNGDAYYVVNQSSTSFQLAATSGGSPITLTAPANTAGMQQFFPAGAPLVTASGQQELSIDLTGAGSGTTQELLGPGGISLRQISPPPGNGVSSAVAKGGSGGAGEFSKPTAQVNSTYTVSAAINANLVSAGGNVTVSTDSQPNESAYAQNGSGGIINIGNAEADLYFTNSNTTTIGNNTQIEAGGDFSMVADNAFNFTDNSTAQGGGFISSAASTANLQVNSATQSNVGTDASITADGVSIIAEISQSQANATGEAQGGGLFGDVNANATVYGASTADVTIGGGAVIDGIAGVTIEADQNNFNANPSQGNSFFIGIGPTLGSANNNTSLTENVTGLSGATIIASPPSAANPVALYVEANANGGNPNSDTHSIDWSSNVIIYDGVSPVLVVDSNGNVVTADNATVNGGNGVGYNSNGGDISVDPIADNVSAEAVFRAPGNAPDSISGSGGLFDFRENFQRVLITNNSTDRLVINEIDVINRGATPPTVELYGSNVTISFLLKHEFTPTLVDIQNLSASDILLQGEPNSAAWKNTDSLIENPIGETRILDTGGNILSAGPWAIIRTNTLGNQFAALLPGETFHGIQATLGSIGAVGAPVNVQLVQSAGRDEQLYAEAGDNVYLSLTGLLRDPTVTNFTVHIDSIVAGGSADVLLQSSIEETAVSGDIGGVLVTVPPNGKSGTFYQQFTYFNPDTNPDIGVDLGVFGSGTTTIASTYDFRLRDNTLTPTTMPGITGGDIIITANNPLPTDPIINVLAITQVSASGYIDVLTNGYITLMEETGDLPAGVIMSTANDVTLYSPAGITDAFNTVVGADVDANVTGVNITLTAGDNNLGASQSESGTGGIGTPEDFLKINVNVLRGATGLGVLNAFDTAAGSTQGIFITDVLPGPKTTSLLGSQTVGDLEVDTVITNANVSLATQNGSIVDARNGGVGFDALANVFGNTIDLYALGGNIGDPSGDNDLKIDSQYGAYGTIGAWATNNIDLTQVSGSAQVALIEALTGNVRFTVRDNNLPGEDLDLLNSGSVLFVGNDPQTLPHGLIDTPQGSVLLRVADNVTVDPNAQIMAGDNIVIYGDFARLNELSSGALVSDTPEPFGYLITSEGTLEAQQSIDIYGGAQPNGNDGNDQIMLWGDISAQVTNVYAGAGPGSATIALNPTNDDGYKLTYISGEFNLYGNTGGDTFVVNQIPNLDVAHKYITGQTGPTSIDPGRGGTLAPGVVSVRDTVNIFGGEGSNQYDINLIGTNDYILNVTNLYHTANPADGSDTLTINGVPGSDTFLLRQGFVALLQYNSQGVLQQDYERINYNTSINVLNVNGLEADDYVYNDATGTVQEQLAPPAYAAQSLTSQTNFYVDGNSAITTLTGADGGDTFQFGQVFGSTRVGGSTVQFGDDVSTIEVAIGYNSTGGIVPGYLTSGPEYATTAYGGDANDTFTVYSNQAPLKLYGEGGNNDFVVRAFALASGSGQSTQLTTIHTGDGNNQITYNVNAPVSIDGGSGVNTVTVLGSGFGDSFVITNQGVEGAGLNVSMTNVDILQVDGISGNNAFYVLSTAPGEVVTLIGGTGNNNTFDIAGDVTTPVIAKDLNGVSGVINNAVSSADPNYNGSYAPGVSVNVASSAAGQVVIGQLTAVGSSTPIPQLFENPLSGPNEGQYTINLAVPSSSPGFVAGTVAYVTVAAALRPYQDTSQGSQSLEVSDDGGATWHQSLVLTFDSSAAAGSATDWNRTQTILVKAMNTLAPSGQPDNVQEGQQTIIISHSILSTNPAFNALPISNLEVNVIDQGLPDAVLTPAHTGNLQVVTGSPTDSGNPFPQQTDSFTVQLNRAPNPGETVTVALNSEVYTTQNYLILSATNSAGAPVFTQTATGATITFNASNWNDKVTVTVAAAPDGGKPFDPIQTVIEDTVTSTGTGPLLFNQDNVQHKLTVNVIDSRLPQVLVTPGTPLTVTPTQPASYTMQLTTAPTAPVYVSLLDSGQTLLSSSSPQFTAASGNTPAMVEFTSSDWNQPVTITVSYNPNYVASQQGNQSQILFPAQAQRTSAIQGPVIIEGYSIPNLNLGLQPAVKLPTETDVPLGTVVSANTQATQTNVLNVFNAGSTQDDAGALTTLNNLAAADEEGILQQYAEQTLNPLEFGNISGEDMTGAAVGAASSPSLTLNFGTILNPDYVTYAGGITYRDVQVVDVMLGSGNDTFTVNATPVQPASSFGADVGDSLTVIQGGGGNNTLIAKGGGGPNSALVLAGSTTQDGVFYDSSTSNITGWARSFNDPGNNILNASADPNPVILYGGPGNDTIYGGAGGDWIAGGSGANTIYGGTGNDNILGSDGFNLNPAYETPINKYEGVLESQVIANNIAVPIRLSAALASLTTSRPVQVLLQVSAPPSGSTYPDADLLTAGNNTIYGGAGNKIIVGNLGVIDQLPAVQSILTTGQVISVTSTAPGDYGNDSIYGYESYYGVGAGNDVILGGSGSDLIYGATGNNIIIGQDGEVIYSTPGELLLISSIDPSYGNSNTIFGSHLKGNDVIIGGTGNDTITGSVAGNDVIIGDNGEVEYWGLNQNPGQIETITSLYPANGGSNSITGGNGDDVIIGGIGNQLITGGTGNNIIIGQDGLVTYTAAGGSLGQLGNNLAVIESADFGYSGGDNLSYGNISSSTDIIFGGGTLADGGVNIIIGGSGDDSIWGGPNNDLIFGGNGQVKMDGYGFGYIHATLITTDFTDPNSFGYAATVHGPGRSVAGNANVNNVIQGYTQASATGPTPTGGGDDILIGGPGNNWIGGGAGDDLIFGGNVTLKRAATTDDPRFQTLTGTQIYTDTATTDTVNVTGGMGQVFRTQSGHVPAWANMNIIALDETVSKPSGDYGNAYIAGGPGDNMIFGEEGINTIQGAGSILGALNPPTVAVTTPGALNTTAQVDTLTLNAFTTTYSLTFAGQSSGSGGVIDGISHQATAAWLASAISALPGFAGTTVTGSAAGGYTITFTQALGRVTTTVTSEVYAYRSPNIQLQVAPGETVTALGALHVNPSFEAATDGNNYIEGGGGNGTVIFGGTGQNDIIGGNSNLFSLSTAAERPDSGNVIIFAGAGTEIADGDSQSTATIGGTATVGDTLSLTIGWVSPVNQASMTATASYTVQAGATAAQLALGLLGAAQNNAALGAAGFTFGTSGNEVVINSTEAYTLTAAVGGKQTETITLAQGGATVGTAQGNVHARNASVVVANNGDIFDLVGTNGTDSGGFLTYNYDSGMNGYIYMPGEDLSANPALNYYGGTQFVIPHAVQLLDYSYGGPDFNAAAAASNIGGTAEIHAESGDTQIYGGPNLDYLFGGSGNDLITGGYGGKWISGGNGDTGETSGRQTINTTGILGSDGRLAMSRNGIAEPLYGIAAVPPAETPNEVIYNQSTINVAGALTVTADLVGTTSALKGAAIPAPHYDDIIYGGLGNAFIYGGPGSTAISSGEAPAVFWNNPVKNPATYLASGSAQHMFAASAPTEPATGVTSLTMAEVDSVLPAAIERLTTALSLSAAQVAELEAAPIQIENLPDNGLGLTFDGTITLSPNAAGWGWFVDPAPYTDRSFPNVAAGGLIATPGSPASGEMDLLTVEMHELAHLVGYGDTSSGLMSEYLSPGIRLAPPIAGATVGLNAGTAISTGSAQSVVSKNPAAVIGSATQAANPATGGALGLLSYTWPQLTGPGAPDGATEASPSATAPAGGLPISDIVVPTEPVGLLHKSLGNGSLHGALSGDGDTSTLGAAPGSLEWSPPRSSSVRHAAATDGIETPTINLNGDGASVFDASVSPADRVPDWLDDFINHVGQDESLRNPNASLRVRPAIGAPNGADLG